MELSIIKSQKGNDMLVYQGVKFYKISENKNKDIKRWECSHRVHKKAVVIKKCNVRVQTNYSVSQILNQSGTHDHDIDIFPKEVNQFNSLIRQGGTDNLASSGIIMTDALCQIDPVLHGYLPSTTATYARIRRAREKAGHNVKVIETEDDLPEPYRVTIGSHPKPFFQKRVEVNSAHALIFSTHENLVSLSNSTVWYSDGVYRVFNEKLYLQMYVLLGTLEGDVEHKARPLLYCIMSHKNMALYTQLYLFIKEYFIQHNIELKCKYAMIDYEIAVKSAIEHVFENQIVVCGCSFHLRMNLSDRAQQFDRNVLNTTSGQMYLNRIYALAFIPINRLQGCVNALKQQLKADNHVLCQLLSWFEDTYITEGSRYAGWWNVHILVDELLPTTNNFAEAFFSSFRKLINHKYAGLLTIIKKIQQVQAITEGSIFKIREGLQCRKMAYYKRVKAIRSVLLEHKHNDIRLLDKISPLLVKKVVCLSDNAEIPSLNMVANISEEDSECQESSLDTLAIPGPSTRGIVVASQTQSSNSIDGSSSSEVEDLIHSNQLYDCPLVETLNENRQSNALPKRRPGRPRKVKASEFNSQVPRRKRGRPRKDQITYDSNRSESPAIEDRRSKRTCTMRAIRYKE